MADTKNTGLAATGELTSIQRAAVVLLTLGETDAVEVLKHLNNDEIQKIGAAMTSMGNVSLPIVQEIMSDFVSTLSAPAGIEANAEDFVRAVMYRALGEERATGLMDRIELGRNTAGLDPLKWMEPRAVSDLIKGEHPQIIAILLSHLEAPQSAAVLQFLEPTTRAEVMLRIATLDGIPPHALNELNDVMQRQFNGSENVRASNIGGVKVAANILNLMDSGNEEGILTHIEGLDRDLCDEIRELMFVFDNLLDLDGRTIQLILREVSNELLGVALRGADERVRQHIISNMSQRAGQILMEDMEARGPVRLTEVESAQKEILAIVRRMADEGTIQLTAKSEAFV
jgi:flagellar motor switch protein FliG